MAGGKRCARSTKAQKPRRGVRSSSSPLRKMASLSRCCRSRLGVCVLRNTIGNVSTLPTCPAQPISMRQPLRQL
eukprot:13978829-Alexandrium_andersonii.AAC.1